jgi:hypothetical protein
METSDPKYCVDISVLQEPGKNEKESVIYIYPQGIPPSSVSSAGFDPTVIRDLQLDS